MRLVPRLLTAIFTGYGLFAFAQGKLPIKSIIEPIDNIRSRLPIEKLFLQLDKPDYTKGDTIWFKAYLLNADYLTASERSGLLYIELDNMQEQCIKRIMVPIAAGISWGNIALDTKEIPDGPYTLRAYTNWMRNFGEDYIFKKALYIASYINEPRLITANIKETKQPGSNNINASLRFSGLGDQPIMVKDIQLNVIQANHTLFTGKTTTSLEGKVAIDFALPDKTPANDLFIQAHDIVKGEVSPSTLYVPITLNRPENTDLQFMPEGGSLTAGIPTRVGFKAISENGKGISITGTVYNSKQSAVTTIKSLYKGMGSFEFTPQTGESYTAVIDLPNGENKRYRLPAVNTSGTALQVAAKGLDSLEITVRATPDLIGNGAVYYLLGQAHGVVCYAAIVSFISPVFKITKAISLFPSGIAHFTLLNRAKLPLNERIIYINRHDLLQLNITASKTVYAPHDSIELQLQVNDSAGKPIKGSFSLAVTDDGQVNPDNTGSNIVNSMLLTSDLKGSIEEPGYYFNNESPQTTAALDNLLLTQGWVGYKWDKIYSPPVKPAFAAEPEFLVQGRVLNLFNKPMVGSQILLFSKKPKLFDQTVTGADGRFVFRGINPIDTASFLVQARTKGGKAFGVGLTVEQFVLPVFSPATDRALPWYVNSDTTAIRDQRNRQIKSAEQDKILHKGQLLKEVVINNKKIVKTSKNLNGPGEADVVIDEKELETAGKTTLGELLEKRISGFLVNGIWRECDACKPIFTTYLLKDKLILFIIDGVDLNYMYAGNNKGPNPGSNNRYNYLKEYLDYYTAEDIIGVEVMSSFKYAAQYASQFIDNPMDDKFKYTFIEITTRGGKGPEKKTNGVYLYKPLPYSLPKQFYRPKYTVNSKPTSSDLRLTIHWEPQIITDSLGRATVTFYSADKPGTYTIKMQGTDLNGLIGFKQTSILVK